MFPLTAGSPLNSRCFTEFATPSQNAPIAKGEQLGSLLVCIGLLILHPNAQSYSSNQRKTATSPQRWLCVCVCVCPCMYPSADLCVFLSTCVEQITRGLLPQTIPAARALTLDTASSARKRASFGRGAIFWERIKIIFPSVHF